ncbi:MAG: hypothetical protein ABIS51_20900 [Sphingomonas sp.]
MHSLRPVLDYLWTNKEWLFDGAGLAVVTSALAGIVWLFRKQTKSATAPVSPSEPKPKSGFRRAPRLEFADGIVAEIALTVRLQTESVFLVLQHAKNADELLDRIMPLIHIRMSQIMEVFEYDEARRLRPEFEHQLVAEFTPKLKEYGVSLEQIGIGTFVRQN